MLNALYCSLYISCILASLSLRHGDATMDNSARHLPNGYNKGAMEID